MGCSADRMGRFFFTFRLVSAWLISTAALMGCASVITPHQAYTPLLDHAGQLDVSVRAGLASPGGLSAMASVAYAPVDHFVLLGGFDGTIGDDTSHYAGMLGVGTFVRHDIFRLEILAGSYGGYAQGWIQQLETGPMDATRLVRHTLQGPYAVPYGLAMIGFEVEVLEVAVGARAFGWLGQLSFDATPPDVGRSDYERFYVEPLATVRLVFGPVRIDVGAGIAANLLGDRGPTSLSTERTLMWHLDAGLGYQFDVAPRQTPRVPEPTEIDIENEPPPGNVHG